MTAAAKPAVTHASLGHVSLGSAALLEVNGVGPSAACAPSGGAACSTGAPPRANGIAVVSGTSAPIAVPATAAVLAPAAQGGRSAAVLTELGTRLKAAGDWRGALEHYYEAVRVDPGFYAAQYNLGVLYIEAGDLRRALEHTEQAYTLEPRSVDAMNNLGAIHRAQGSHEAAVQWYRAAAALSPDCQMLQTNLAVALVGLGLHIKTQNPKGAVKCYQEALVHYPTNANAYYNLGVSYAELQKYDKALINYQLTVHFNPRCAEAYNNMGVIYKERDNLERAFACYQMALQCNPRFAQALNNLGMACTATGRLSKALEYLARAVAAVPSYAEAYNNLGWLFWDQGDLEQALRMYERCIELAPSSKNPSQNRLLALNYAPDTSPQLVYEAHRAWGERFCRELGAPCCNGWPLLRREVGRRLRVGYISPDFFHHSVSFFAQCLLEHRDRERFDVFLYSNTSREDETTARFRQLVSEDRWKKVLGKSAPEVAGMIQEDRIDILVELAGHTANNRLDVVALKPAPVQFTYIGYNNTTGLGAVDYRITDAITDPPDSQQPFSEELVRLPGCFLCYTPPTRIPEVGPLPATTAGCITFGSFSCLAKVNEKCIALWARVLQDVPNSRLLVKAKGFYSREVQVRFAMQFERHGIAAHRLRLLSLTPTSYDHLNTYNEVDIGLDTFPYSNTTTTCETLLMGVPVVCLSGNTHGSRVGVTLLSALGLSELVAQTHDDYVDKAMRLASDLQKLTLLRQNMRQALLASPLCEGPRFVREKYEPVLAEKWELFCKGRPPSMQQFSSEEPPDPLAPGAFVTPLPPGAAAAAALCQSVAALPQAALTQSVWPGTMATASGAPLTHTVGGAPWPQQLPVSAGGVATLIPSADPSAWFGPVEVVGGLGSSRTPSQRLSPM